MSVERTISDGGVRLREAHQQVAHLELTLVQVRGEAQALRAEMETQRNRATQLEQLFQQQVMILSPLLRLPSLVFGLESDTGCDVHVSMLQDLCQPGRPVRSTLSSS